MLFFQLPSESACLGFPGAELNSLHHTSEMFARRHLVVSDLENSDTEKIMKAGQMR
jgi:hypothetical protein